MKLNMADQESTESISKMKTQNDRGRNWEEKEVSELIGIWSDEVIQQELEGSQRNQHVYKKICKMLK